MNGNLMQMKGNLISLGDIALKSDAHQWMVCEQKTQKNKDTGERENIWVAVAYYSTLSGAVRGCSERLLRTAGATTVEDLIEASNRISLLLNQRFTASTEVRLKHDT